MFPHALLLALAAAELHQLDPGTLGEALDPRHEVPRHRRHQRRRRHRLAAHLAEEPRRSPARLQDRHVGVEVHPVDALEFERRVLVENFRRASCYRHGSDSGRWATHGPPYGHRRLRATRNRGLAPQRSSGRGPFTVRYARGRLVGLRRSLAGVLEQVPSLQLSQVFGAARVLGLSAGPLTRRGDPCGRPCRISGDAGSSRRDATRASPTVIGHHRRAPCTRRSEAKPRWTP